MYNLLNMISMEIWSILVYSGLVFVTILIQATYSARTAGVAYGLSNHTESQPNKGPAGKRIDNTLNNLKEGAVMYLPLAILAVTLDVTNAWTYYAALATILSRVLYVPTYIFGIEKLRSIIFTPSLLAVPAMAVGIILGLLI